VAIYFDLSRSEEAKLFIDINTTQRGVPAALLLDIKQIAEIESTKEQLLRELFDKLNNDSKSPLVGKLSATKSLKGRISRVTFNRALSNALSAGVLVETEPEYRYKLIVNYLNALDAELPDKSLLVKSAFFEAVFDVIDEVLRATLALHKDVKQDSIQKVIRPIARLNFTNSSTSRVLPTKKEMVSAMQTALRRNVTLSEDML